MLGDAIPEELQTWVTWATALAVSVSWCVLFFRAVGTLEAGHRKMTFGVKWDSGDQ